MGLTTGVLSSNSASSASMELRGRPCRPRALRGAGPAWGHEMIWVQGRRARGDRGLATPPRNTQGASKRAAGHEQLPALGISLAPTVYIYLGLVCGYC